MEKMKRIKGSYIAKIIAWVLLLGGGLIFVENCVALSAMEEYGVFREEKEAVMERKISEINDRYSVKAIQNYRNGMTEENKKYFEKKAFRYGIIEAKTAEGLDLSEEAVYLERNFTGAPKEEPYQFYMRLSADDTIWDSDTLLGGYSYSIRDEAEKSMYADAICYDVTGGIFYYRAYERYYPVQNVSLLLTWTEGEETWTDGESESGEFVPFTFNNNSRKYTAQYPMGTEGEEMTFNVFDKTDFAYTQWTELIFDDVRYLDASELIIIDSDQIPKSSFVEVDEAYLDSYYTLHVCEKTDKKDYLVVSYLDRELLAQEKQQFLDNIGKMSFEKKLEEILLKDNADLYVRTDVILTMLYQEKDNVLGMLTVSALLVIGSFVFLVCAAGHRRKKEEIVLTFIDKIPLDLLLAAVFAVSCIAGSFFMHANYIGLAHSWGGLWLLAVVCILLVCVFMTALLSFAVRIKAGKWWRNSIVYWIYKKCRDIAAACWRERGILWKLMAGAVVYSLFQLWIIGMTSPSNGSIAIVYFFFEKIIICRLLFRIVSQTKKLQEGSRLIAEGDLQAKIDTKNMYWEFKKHADNLNRISEGMSHAVDERMKSERFKTELITNVSHDIKTPLTSIINYVDLLEKEDIANETAKEYLEVLERQSSRLKKLIEDLIEASKASTGNLTVTTETLDANVFVTQVLGEYEEKLSAAGLELIVNKPEKELTLHADGRHLYRVADNLMNNICKYAQPGSRVYINLEETENSVLLTFKNMSKYALNITSGELMERFVRGDASRNTEGNGLGLSIAKSLTELMKGKLSLYVDGDLFKVVLEFPK